MRESFAAGALLLTVAAGAGADATLTYRLATGTEQEARQLRIAVARFFARIESSAAPDGWWLVQAGKFFPVYWVDARDQTWTRLTPEVTARLGPANRASSSASAAAVDEPVDGTAALKESAPKESVPHDAAPAQSKPAETTSTPAPTPPPVRATSARTFVPSAKRETVAGVHCRVVDEWRDGVATVQHCMANKAALGITEREMRTLARTFAIARERGFGWLGRATADEAFVSVRSRELDGDGSLVLESVSTDALPVGHLRIPRTYRQVSRQRTQPQPAPSPEAVAPLAGEGDDG